MDRQMDGWTDGWTVRRNGPNPTDRAVGAGGPWASSPEECVHFTSSSPREIWRGRGKLQLPTQPPAFHAPCTGHLAKDEKEKPVTIMNNAAMNIHIQAFLQIYIFLSIYLGIELLNYTVTVCYTF